MGYRRFIAALSVIFVVLAPSFAFAQNNNAGQGLEISPPLIEIKTDPGKTQVIQIRVRNVTTQTLIVRGQVNDFVAAGEDGRPKLLLDSNEQSPYSIKPWIDATSSVTLNPSERKTIDVTMNVPPNASPGGHYGVIRFTGTPPELEGTGVSLSASVGTLVLATVSGDVHEQAHIAQIVTSQNGKNRNTFEYGPVTITTRVQNTGNVHIQPSGTIRVTNTFGKTVATYQFNQDKGNILPQSVRKFNETLNKKLLFGRYKIQADVVYGSNKTITGASTTFWVIPYKLILIVIAAIALLIFMVRRYNRLIVKQATKKKQSNGSTTKKKKK